jgi:16S rRNA (cytidine1402-2'-O)-methyltransferase
VADPGPGPAAGTLFVVAVPIGNPDDLSPRARRVLAAVTVVAAEDTRHFATLARHHGLATRAVSYHDHNEAARTLELIGRLEAGEDVALVSDAGTPLISDPGYRLVRAAIDAGIPVTSLPGPSAVTTALAASGLPPHPFRFLGFLPRTRAARRAALDAVSRDPTTLVAFEAPRRLLPTLRDAVDVLGDRDGCVARNLTKPHERWQRGSLSAIAADLEAEGEVRGEATLVIRGATTDDAPAKDAEDDARLLLANGAPPRAVQELLEARHRLSRREAYALVLRVSRR